MHIKTRNFEKGVVLVQLFEKNFKKSDTIIIEEGKIVICFCAAIVYFGCGKHKEALRWLNRIIHHTDSKIRPDYQSLARILNIIIQYESGNMELIESAISSAERFLKTRKTFYKIEEAFMRFSKTIITSISAKKKKELFAAFGKQLTAISKNPYEKQSLNYFDFIAWVENKIEGKSFA